MKNKDARRLFALGRAVIWVLCSACLAPLVALAAPPPLDPAHHWVIAPSLSDEFSGGSLDQSKWMPHHPYWHGGRGPGHFVPEDVSVANGALRLTGSVTGPPGSPHWVGMACVSSVQPIAFYGYYEAHMRANALPGSASAFWMQNPKSEIDVQEAFGRPFTVGRPFNMQSSLHFFPYSALKPAGALSSTANAKLSDAPVTDWHTYGVWWQDANNVLFYLDGRLVGHQAPKVPFTTPMYIFFDTEILTQEGTPTVEQLSDAAVNTMYVDWIRSYKLEPN